MKVILAEKPSVARDIAKIVGANQRNDGYLSGNDYAVTYAFGHLIELANIKKYQEHLSLDNLPVIPEKIDLELASDQGKRKQFAVIKKLFKEADEIINATDAGREGELIFRYIYLMAKVRVPFKRLWISSMTDEAIKKGFATLKNGLEYNNLYYSAKARAEADWLVGLNGSIALTRSANTGRTLSVGRVQSPTVALIVNRYLENKNFVPEDYFTIFTILKSHDQNFKAIVEGKFSKKEEAEKTLEKISDKALVKDIEKKETRTATPLPFDLTSLQAEANKKHGYSAQETLQFAQNLYERHKIITYPRTDSRYLSKDMINDIYQTFETLKSYQLKSYAQHLEVILERKNKRPINDKKVTDHHAIIPTGKNPQGLAEGERNIYKLVLFQFCKAFHKPVLKDSTKVVLDSNEVELIARGNILKDIGFKIFDGKKLDEEDEDTLLPPLEKDEITDVISKEIEAKKTKPLPILTEASLLKLMETAGKLLDDEDSELAEAMKEKGIGTPATRAGIIETIIRRGYIKREKKKLIPSDLGIEFVKNLEGFAILSPKLTGDWEHKLKQIEKGELEYKTFNDQIKAYTHQVTDQMKNSGKGFTQFVDPNLQDCPVCGKGKLKHSPKSVFCTNNKYSNGDCNFYLPKTIAKKKLTDNQIQELLTKGETGFLKGFVAKSGNKFEAALKINKEKAKVDMIFRPREEAKNN
ncbi:MAG: DNA topoisomerase III [Flavobacteriia bacterium]|nr:MAG: DNA topoisomerase III [Flavobacteriia bacterium]